MPQGSKIFLPNRALGYVSNHIPLQIRYIKSRRENLITTSVGKLFHTYGISHFTLLSVSNLHEGDISCMTSDAYHIYTACENVIYAWRRGTELKHTYRGHKHDVHLMIPFGKFLLSIDESSVVKVWDIKTEELFLELTFSNEDFRISALVHPSTYVNKILLGSEQGSLQLWNINSVKLIYTFKGWNSEVTCLEQAPAVDVMGIGLANGKIILHNLKFDKTVMEFTQDWGLVTGISFRTDNFPIMATGSTNGNIIFWSLEERRIHSILMNAHDGSVTGMKFISNEPLIVTSSPDNTLKLWIFDMPDGGARLLRIREGHSSSPTYVSFHGANGENILSSSGDSTLRIFNTKTETFNKNLGKASYNRKASKRRGRLEEDVHKMPPIIQFTSETTREKEWDNIAAIHLGIPVVTTWSYDKLRMGDLKLLPERFATKKTNFVNKNISATCVSLTHCGNFVLVGYSTGHVDRFNIQSGMHRDVYGDPAHNGPVRGVAVDGLNHVVLTTSNDAVVKFWRFKCNGSESVTKLHIEEAASFLRSHRESSMVGIALENFSVIILDVDTRMVIRKMIGHTSQLTDMDFSVDSRWLLSSSMDCTIKIWDIPSGQLVDHFRTESACINLSFSPTCELLVTAHVDYKGLFLWANRALYTHVPLKALPENAEAPLMELADGFRDLTEQDFDEIYDDEEEFTSPEQITSELVTLSNLAQSRWQNLLNIDVIKRRNKPKAPLKAPKSAPFFLPTIPSLNFQFDLNNTAQTESSSKLIKSQNFVNLSTFGKLLQSSIQTENFEDVIEKLKNMGPSMIDFEIKSLSPDGGGTIEVMLQFLKCIEFMLKSNRNFELAQSYLGVFLKSHGVYIASKKILRDYLLNVQSCQTSTWKRLEDKLFYNICTTQALKTM